MDELPGRWIWFAARSPHENMVGLFAHPFAVENPGGEKLWLRITAETRYVVCLNSRELGRGPIRSYPGQKFYDTYDLTAMALPGENLLTVRVWDYGLSTYQSVAGRAGLCFDVRQGEKCLAASGTDTRALPDGGHRYNTVKRNVNLGFMEYHDAAKAVPFWQELERASRDWPCATVLEGVFPAPTQRPIPLFSTRRQLPLRVVKYQQVAREGQQVSVNTRPVFFPERRDANDTIFAGFLGVVIDSPSAMDGRISFPNRTWNGIIGNFTLGGKLYPVSNENREIDVRLDAGKQLFLLQISGKYDDLFCHMEFRFPEQLTFTGLGETGFFLVGPTALIQSVNDGRSKVYGGLEEYDRMEVHTAKHETLFACSSLEELQGTGAPLLPAPGEYVFYDEYVYSLVRCQRVVKQLPVDGAVSALLHNNTEPTLLELPSIGICNQLILDFGDIYIGPLEFSLRATAGTVLDVYGFENMFEGEMDPTVGLNNAVRYVCREGSQTYRCLTRTGCRYLAITLREQTGPVELGSIALHHSTYAASGIGSFRCGDDKLNRIWEMCRQTHLDCMEDTFTDCPTYEQAYWIGDALISAYINAWLYGEYPLMRHCLHMGAGALYNTPLMNALGPTDWNTSIPMWSMNWLLAIEKYVEMSGDDSVVGELFPAVSTLMETFAGFLTPDGGFLLSAWNMLDWAPLDIHNHDVVTGQQAILVDCCRLCAAFADSLGETDKAAKYRSIREQLIGYIDGVLWDEGRGAFLDGCSPEHGLSKTISVQSHSLLVLYDAISDPRKRAAAEKLLAEPPEDFVQAGSPFFLFYVYELWAKGDMQRVLDDIRLRWSNMMRYDCTTCWEVFPGFYEVGRTRSYCHSWSASPAYFLGRYVLGIYPTAPGFRALELRVPDLDLAWCEGCVPTPYGGVTVYWSRENGGKTYRIVAPKQVEITAVPGFDWDVTVTHLD